MPQEMIKLVSVWQDDTSAFVFLLAATESTRFMLNILSKVFTTERKEI